MKESVRTYDDFTKEVCLSCYRSTKDKWWSDEVVDWFFRMDFIPANWHDDYLRFVKDL